MPAGVDRPGCPRRASPNPRPPPPREPGSVSESSAGGLVAWIARLAEARGAVFYLAERVDLRMLLIVTSAIYGPCTYLVAARVLDTPFEVVGTPTSAAADRGELAQRVGQELHSTIKAVAALAVTCPQNPLERADSILT